MENSTKISFGMHEILTGVALVVAFVALSVATFVNSNPTIAQTNTNDASQTVVSQPIAPTNADQKLFMPGIIAKARAASVIPAPNDQLTSKILEELRIVRENGAQISENENIDSTVGFHAPNAVLMVGGTAPLVGRDQIKAFYQYFYSTFDVISLDFVDDGAWHISRDGKHVVNYVDEIITLRDRVSQTLITIDIDLVDVYEKIGDEWFLVFEQASKRVPLL